MSLTRGQCNIAQALRTVREDVLIGQAGDRLDAVNVVVVFVHGR